MNKAKKPQLSAPEVSIQTAVKHAKTLFDQYMGSSFTKNEMATKWGNTVGGGAFNGRVALMVEYRLLEKAGDNHALTKLAKELFADGTSESRSKSIQYEMAVGTVFAKMILSEFSNRVPEVQAMVTRLTEKGFTMAKSEKAATALRESLSGLKAIDGKGHVLPLKDAGRQGSDEEEGDEGHDPIPKKKKIHEPQEPDLLVCEVPLSGGRKGVIHYPEGMTKADAAKLAGVLTALADP